MGELAQRRLRPRGRKTTYTYDSMYRMASAAVTTDTGLNLSASYTYEDDLLTKIQTASTTYNFTYGSFGLRSSVKVGTQALATYSYTQDGNNYLSSLDYGNGDKVQYEYDNLGRVTKQTYEDGDTVTYQYDNSGALATVTDSATGRKTTYYYDFTDRLMKYVETGSNYYHSVGYEYDQLNNLTSLVETINGTDYTTSYVYDDDNRVTSVTTNGTTVEYTYDAYGRISSQVTASGDTQIKTDSFSFKNPSETATSSQIAEYTVTSSGFSNTYAYDYDDNGNIQRITDSFGVTEYTYDSANQLIREDNEQLGFTYVWTYDSAGNILSRTEYAYTPGSLTDVTPVDTITYTYGNSEWGDLLTAYDGTAITYDEIGNPLSDGTWTYTWEHGRELVSMSDGSASWNFTYDSNGLRTKRTYGMLTYEYVYNGSQLAEMVIANLISRTVNTLHFSYDANGTPTTVTYNGYTYYYVTNIQGDVVAILNSSGTAVVTYAYDAWGNILSTGGSMASSLGATNPLRYRGYVYDQETGLYYLQSRYYDPEIGRFLNADSFTSTGQGMLGNNMFAYCLNNPVNLVDYSGQYAIEAILAIILAIVAAVAIVIMADCFARMVIILINELSSSPTPKSHKEDPPQEEKQDKLPHQGHVTGDPDAPPVDAGKQGKHVPGHNNYDKNRSSWPEGQTGVEQTQEAWKNGTPDPKKPDGSVRIGTASDGTTVRVHQDSSGAIHGYPIKTTEIIIGVIMYACIRSISTNVLAVERN